ncbi:MAG: FkbM family methyltransferase [Patescibacteria group bacterium]
MINFSGISASGFAGSSLRRIAKILPRNIPLPIVKGPLRGRRWILGSGVLGYWLGSYELEKQTLFASFIKPGDVVFDVGAQAGFYTLLASVRVGSEGKVFSFEPFPENFKNVKKHLELNAIHNVSVLELAVSDRSGEIGFMAGTSTSTGAISDSGTIKVKTESLDNLVVSGRILPPNVIKMDIEGAEVLALRGANTILEKYKPIILLATHSVELKKECLELLTRYGYVFSAPTGDVAVSDEIIARPA